VNNRLDKSNMAVEAAPAPATLPSEKSGTDECFVADSQKGVDVHSPGTPVEITAGKQNEGEVQSENEHHENSNGSDDDEIKYPGRLTKVAVGFSLSLAIFLV
jgi:hypothetical protein